MIRVSSLNAPSSLESLLLPHFTDEETEAPEMLDHLPSVIQLIYMMKVRLIPLFL